MFFFFSNLERCIAVSSPFLAKRYCTVRSARISVFTLIAVALIIFSSTFPIIYDQDHRPNRKKCFIRPHLAFIHRAYQPIILYGIPDLLLLSNFYTLYVLFKRRKEQKRLSDITQSNIRVSDVNSNRKQRQLTIMLVTVNLAFYLFQTPTMIKYITAYTSVKFSETGELKRLFLFLKISVSVLQLNNAVSKFRLDLLLIFTLDEFYILLSGWSTFSTGNSPNISHTRKSSNYFLSSIYSL